ncbi:uncharacterized protein LOC126664416 [Mercurialis annua]|uniref:uncharacterized protein LOC126664416 n=1 Tax=Mercurialis annua TaxID=3986 RepID=UPI002160CB9B|nr:uncharacterized protein LOC126664416 [Mercurialis annua]
MLSHIYYHHQLISFLYLPLPMDWFSWLSRTNLESSLVYEYGLAFSRNELQQDDLAYFNHEFLQSMGISVAKHRLEILKLARKEAGALSGIRNAINRTKKSIKRCISKLVFHEEQVFKALPEPVRPVPHTEQWRGGLTRKYKSDKEIFQTPGSKIRRQAKSGPLDGRLIMPENLLQNQRALKLSGPLDGKVHDRLVFAYKSPKFYGNSEGRVQQKLVAGGGKSPKMAIPLDGKKDRMIPDDQSLWSALFLDMKPT